LNFTTLIVPHGVQNVKKCVNQDSIMTLLVCY